jgi:site-specific DNA-methyltransferase (adenine-specific)
MNWSKDIQVFNEDCMATMKRYPDNYFDLAIVDPPYGIGEDGMKNHSRGKAAKAKKYTPKDWDRKTPSLKYFEELKRVSKDQIIWGANYMIDKIISPSMGWIFWDKGMEAQDFSDGELAYTSFNRGLKKYRFVWNGMLQGDMKNKEIRIHPTQKPCSLYLWLYKNYAKKGFKIIDTHYGSGSNGIALDSVNKIEKMELTLIASEIDKDYYNDAKKRFDKETAWQSIF